MLILCASRKKVDAPSDALAKKAADIKSTDFEVRLRLKKSFKLMRTDGQAIWCYLRPITIQKKHSVLSV